MDVPVFDYDVFISFAASDEAIVKPLWQELASAGLRVFWSDDALRRRVGSSWFDVIQSSLERSRHMVLVCTPAGLASKWVQREYVAFYNHCYMPPTRLLVPVLAQGTNVTALPLFLRELQTTPLNGHDLTVLFGRGDLDALRRELAARDREVERLGEEVERLSRIVEERSGHNEFETPSDKTMMLSLQFITVPMPDLAKDLSIAPLAQIDNSFVAEHVTEAEVFARYGLQAKAAEHLCEILKRYPHHKEALKRLYSVLIDGGYREAAKVAGGAYINLLQGLGDDAEIERVRKAFAASSG